MRILLTGDHSDYHCGSAAAFRAIYDEARSHGRIVDGEADDYDLLVVNGEGSMHHDSRSCRSKMKQIRRALVDGRQVALVNSVWQDNPTEYAEVLKQCCSVVVREVCSARELASLGVHADVNIDQAFFCEVEDVEPFDFKGDVLVTDFYSKEFSTFIKVTGKWADKFTYIDLNQWDWSRLIHSMRTASLIITGRHHAVYAACKAKLPFLALEGNTHKIRGLIETAGSNIPVFRSFEDLRKIVDGTSYRSFDYDQLFSWMELQPRWRLVA